MVFIPIIITIILGIVLGSIPVINEYLHWNLWFVVPVGGMLIGAGLGWIQFMTGYFLNIKFSFQMLVVLGFSSVVSYIGTDWGIYWSLSVPVSGIENIPDGNYRLKDIVSFSDYMFSMRLGSSSYTTKHGIPLFKYGSVGTTLTFIIDLIGCFIASIGTQWAISDKYPYCNSCNQFKKRDTLFEILFQYNEEVVQNIFSTLVKHIEAKNYQALVDYLKDAFSYIRSKEKLPNPI